MWIILIHEYINIFIIRNFILYLGDNEYELLVFLSIKFKKKRNFDLRLRDEGNVDYYY